MVRLVEYLKDFAELSAPELTSFAQEYSDQDPNGMTKLLNELCRNDNVPIAAVAALVYCWAESVNSPTLQQSAIEKYLSMKCSEILNLDRVADRSTEEILDCAQDCKVPEQCRDFSVATARLLLIDDKWWLTFNATDYNLEWLQSQWLGLAPTRLVGAKKQPIGNTAQVIKGLLQDARSQSKIIAIEASKHLKSRRFRQFALSISQGSKLLGGLFSLLTRAEKRIAQHEFRLWDTIQKKIEAQPEEVRIVSNPHEARVLLNEIEGDLAQLLSHGEFVLLDMCIPIQVALKTHIESEMDRWGIGAPTVKISSERLVYPFRDDTDHVLLEIDNDGNTSIDKVIVSVSAVDGIRISPANFEIHNMDPGDVIKQYLEMIIPANKVRLEIDWNVDIRDEFDATNNITGTISIEVDRDTPWSEIENKPNPYPTDPVEMPDKLYGRETTLREISRVAISGESRYLTGQRRVGKTSVALVLLETLNKQQFIPVYAPWGEIGGNSFDVVCRQLCTKLREEAIRVQSDLEAIHLPSTQEFESGFNQATVGFIRRIRTTARRNIVIVLDDFDDVPDWVYSGETGDLFFSMLKTLTGSRGISLIFVGGQRLRTIMRSPVAGKLNQVTPIDLRYLPQQAMQDLVKDPTKDILQFEKEAIDCITYWSACNPFYANRICNQLWNFMVERKWTYVVAEDIERIVNEIVSHDDSPMFSHFWLDGIWGEGDVQRAAINSNCATLYAFGRLSAIEPESRHFHFEDIKRECRYLTEHELEKWLGDLVAREVVERHPEYQNYFSIRTPYFQLWLSRRGQSELYASLDPSIIISLQKPEEEAITDEQLEDLLGKGIRYRTGTIGVYEVRKFLKQFGSADNQRLAYRLIEKLIRDGFFSNRDVEDAAVAAVEALSRHTVSRSPGFVKSLTQSGVWANMFVVIPSQTSVSSFQVLADILRQKENLSKHQVGTPSDLLKFIRQQRSPIAVLLFDDVIGTGNTAYAAIQEVLEVITASNLQASTASILFYGVAGFRDVVEDLNQRLAGNAIVEVQRGLGEADQAFHPYAGIFDTEEEREQCQKLVESIGTKLEPKCPLGYGGRQALISFFRNTPNITLPIFHKVSRRKDFRWQPLFRRM